MKCIHCGAELLTSSVETSKAGEPRRVVRHQGCPSGCTQSVEVQGGRAQPGHEAWELER